jgi:hypothetical protein
MKHGINPSDASKFSIDFWNVVVPIAEVTAGRVLAKAPSDWDEKNLARNYGHITGFEANEEGALMIQAQFEGTVRSYFPKYLQLL